MVWGGTNNAELIGAALAERPLQCGVNQQKGKKMETNIEKRNGKRGVVIREDKWSVEVLTMRNGYQWSGMPMDAELLDMLQEAITEFKAMRANA